MPRRYRSTFSKYNYEGFLGTAYWRSLFLFLILRLGCSSSQKILFWKAFLRGIRYFLLAVTLFFRSLVLLIGPTAVDAQVEGGGDDLVAFTRYVNKKVPRL